MLNSELSIQTLGTAWRFDVEFVKPKECLLETVLGIKTWTIFKDCYTAVLLN